MSNKISRYHIPEDDHTNLHVYGYLKSLVKDKGNIFPEGI